MNINITTLAGTYAFDLNSHDIEVADGDLWVYGVNEHNTRIDVAAVYAKGQWKRVEFDRDFVTIQDHGMGPGPYDD